MKITSIDHVQLAMPSGRELDAEFFYSEVLGMSVVPKPEALQRRGGRWFKSGTAQIHLGVDSGFTAVKKAHPGIVVEGFDELVERLKSFNINFVLDDEIPQLRRMYVEDPFGNRIEIIDQRSLSDLPY